MHSCANLSVFIDFVEPDNVRVVQHAQILPTIQDRFQDSLESTGEVP